MGIKLLEFKTRGLKPVEIEEELQSIRDDFIAGGIHYDPLNDEKQKIVKSKLQENVEKNVNSASVPS